MIIIVISHDMNFKSIHYVGALISVRLRSLLLVPIVCVFAIPGIINLLCLKTPQKDQCLLAQVYLLVVSVIK